MQKTVDCRAKGDQMDMVVFPCLVSRHSMEQTVAIRFHNPMISPKRAHGFMHCSTCVQDIYTPAVGLYRLYLFIQIIFICRLYSNLILEDCGNNSYQNYGGKKTPGSKVVCPVFGSLPENLVISGDTFLGRHRQWRKRVYASLRPEYYQGVCQCIEDTQEEIYHYSYFVQLLTGKIQIF